MDGLNKNMMLDMIEAEVQIVVKEIREKMGLPKQKGIILATTPPPIESIDWLVQGDVKHRGVKVPLALRYEGIPLLMVVIPIGGTPPVLAIRFLSQDYSFQLFPPDYAASYGAPAPEYSLDECTELNWLVPLKRISEEFPDIPARHMHLFMLEMCEANGLEVPPYVDRSYASEVEVE